jgi:hypothetical protein
MILFTSAHFVIGRYLLYLFPLVLLSVVLVSHVALKREKWLFSVLMLSVSLMFYHLSNKADARMNTGDNLNYIAQIKVLQDGIQYLRDEDLFDECIAGSFLIQQALTYPIQGYVEEGNKPDCALNHIPEHANYVMMISYEPDAGLEWVKSDAGFEKVFFSKHGNSASWVYKRK